MKVIMGRLKQKDLAERDRQRRATCLGDLLANSIPIFCWCNRCGHSSSLPPDLLVAEAGPALPVPDIGQHLRCSGCGSKDISTRPEWPTLGQVTRHG